MILSEMNVVVVELDKAVDGEFGCNLESDGAGGERLIHKQLIITSPFLSVKLSLLHDEQ